MPIFIQLALAAAVSAAVPVEVETLDHASQTGHLTQLSAEAVALDTPAGPRRVPVDRLLSVRITSYEAPRDADRLGRVELVGGSVLSIQQYTVSMDVATLTLPGGAIVELPVRAISAVRFGGAAAVGEAQWREILGVAEAGDLLVIAKGDVIDSVEGVVGEIGRERVAFRFEGEEVQVPLRKVRGVIYYRPSPADPLDPICHAFGAGATRLALAKIAVDGDRLRGVTTGRLAIVLPLRAISTFDFSLGKLYYLSDLEPLSVEWTPFFAFARADYLARAIGQVRRDRAIEGGPLRLGGQQYARGLAMRSRTEVVYRLRGQYREFTAVAGIDDRMGERGDVRLVIRGDGRELFEQPVRGGDAPLPLKIDVRGVDRLTLLVDFGEDADVADHFDLCDARISK